MMNSRNRSRVQELMTWAGYLAAVASLISIMVVVGWILDITILKQVLPGLVSMKINTAVCIGVLGTSLWYWIWLQQTNQDQRIQSARLVLIGAALITVLIGLLTTLQYFFNTNYGIDELLAKDDTSVISTSSPGRMAINTSITFIILGLSWLLLGIQRQTNRAFYLLQGLATTGGFISLLGLLGYAYNVQTFYGLSSYTKMALHTAIAFFLLSISCLLATADRGWMAEFVSDYAGGVMTRRLMLYAMLLPLIIGWIILSGFRLNAFNSAMGIALFVVINMVILAISISLVSRQLNSVDRERQRSADRTRQLYQDLAVKAQLLEETNQSLQQEIFDRQRAEESKAELQQLLTQLKETQIKLVQSEKMSSLGQLVAGIAHEINNPINFIYGNILPADQYIKDLIELINLYQEEFEQVPLEIEDKIAEIDLEFVAEDLPKLLGSMKVGAERVCDLVKSLRIFSRLDESESKSVNLHECIDSTLTILRHNLKDRVGRSRIVVTKSYGQLPEIECYPGPLNQVFMNLLVNAIDALEERDQHRSFAESQDQPSQIEIITELLKPDSLNHSWVRIRIRDNGPGIEPTTLEKLFDPFFTTKPVGKGTGLGLSISHQIIVEKHHGQLMCNSIVGEGSEFVIEIPVKQTVSLKADMPLAANVS